MITDRHLKIFGISGSNRKSSTNIQIMRHLATHFPPNTSFQIFEDIASLPHFNPDDDTEVVNETVEDFRNQIRIADGLVICTPEYVFSLPGSLKNAIEWLVSTTILSHKPGALITASTSGEEAHKSLQLIMKTLELDVSEDRTLLIKAPKTKIDKDGGITDPTTSKALFNIAAALVTKILSSKKPF